MLAAGTWILLAATTVIMTAYLYVTTFMRKRRPGEPEIPRGRFLWGNAVDFGTHAVEFLHKCEKAHGNCFTLRLINQFLTIIVDPHCYEEVNREKNFDFDPIQKQVNWNVFGFVIKDPKTMTKDTGKTVRGHPLNRGMARFVNNLNDSCVNIEKSITSDTSTTEADWQVDGLKQFTSNTMFNAIFNTLFGQSDNEAFNASMVHRNFETFHKYFNYFWLGMPKMLFPTALKALNELLVMPDSDQLMAREDCSDYLRTAMTFMKNKGQTEADIKGHNLVYLHVNYNTYRLSFWAMSNLLEDEKAHAALTDEIHSLVDEHLDEQTNTAALTMKDVESLKLLDSFVNETMRLASGVFMVRYVKEDTWFTTSDGKQHLIRKGDRVAMYPPAIHKNPEIFEDPLVFKYDRFVDTTFYKNGKALKTPVNAFGTLCPGKRYAILQLKWYILTTLTRFDLRQRDGEHAQYAYEYHGHEVLPPKQDIKFDFRQRHNYPTLEFSAE